MKARHPSGVSRRGFTLVEVLVTMVLLAVVLPAVMHGITLANQTGGTARRRTQAAGLAEEKLNELIAVCNNQPANAAGDFSPNFPDYTWRMTVQPNWPLDTTGGGLQQIDMTVSWTDYGRQQSLTISTLFYPRLTTGTQ